MRLIFGLILLAFPFVELFLLVELAHRYGWWLLVYLVVIGFLGLQLIKGEKLQMSAKMMQSLSAENLRAGGNPIKTLIGTARNMVAGVFLLVPGVISDAIAVILLLIPIQQVKVNAGVKNDNVYQDVSQHNPFETNTKATKKKAANDDVIEGEFVEIKDDPKK